MNRLPAIDSHATLVTALKADLGYCECAYSDTLPKLAEFLRRVAARSDAARDAEAFRTATDAVEAFVLASASPGVGSWFVYALERADLLWHGFNLFDVWVTDKGRWLLAGLQAFPEPPPDPDSPDEEPSP